MQVSIKIEKEDYALLQKIKEETKIKSSPIVIRLALANFVRSRDYAKLKLGLLKEIK